MPSVVAGIGHVVIVNLVLLIDHLPGHLARGQEAFQRVPDDLDVLLRHRPRSISRPPRNARGLLAVDRVSGVPGRPLHRSRIGPPSMSSAPSIVAGLPRHLGGGAAPPKGNATGSAAGAAKPT